MLIFEILLKQSVLDSTYTWWNVCRKTKENSKKVSRHLGSYTWPIVGASGTGKCMVDCERVF